MNVGCFLDDSASIVIVKHVRVGPHVKILTGSHTYANSVMLRGPGSFSSKKPVVLEDGVWGGLGTIIMPSVAVSAGCVIGAGSVVLNSTAPNGLYAGNPAARIKNLPLC